MTKKDYDLIGKVIGKAWGQILSDSEGQKMPAWRAFIYLLKEFVSELKKHDPDFSEGKFRDSINKFS